MYDIFSLMNLTEFQLKTRMNNFKSSIYDLKKSITEISNGIVLDIKFNNITQKSSKFVINIDFCLLNAYIELKKIIDSFNQTNVVKQLKSILQNE